MNTIKSSLEALDLTKPIWQHLLSGQTAPTSPSQKAKLISDRDIAIESLKILSASIDSKIIYVSEIDKEMIKHLKKLIEAEKEFYNSYNYDMASTALASIAQRLPNVDRWLCDRSILHIKDLTKKTLLEIEKGRELQKELRNLADNYKKLNSSSQEMASQIHSLNEFAKHESSHIKEASSQISELRDQSKSYSENIKSISTQVDSAEASVRIDHESVSKTANKIEDRYIKISKLHDQSSDAMDMLLKRAQMITDDLEVSRTRAHEILFTSNVASLANSWLEKKKAAANQMWIFGICSVAFALVGGFLALTIVFPSLVPWVAVTTKNQSLLDVVVLKFTIALPIVFLIWFCSNNFSKAFRRFEKYESIQANAQAVDANRVYLEEISSKSENDPELENRIRHIIVESIASLTSHTSEKAADTTLEREPEKDSEKPKHFERILEKIVDVVAKKL